ncbi:MAG: hypothetical protein IKN04_17890 [Clostridia bacterium]|nr:hypothetical protein [Clostridia bacterium]
MTTAKNARFQVITYSPDMGGQDEKLEYPSIREARRAIKKYWPDYDGWAIWDHVTKRYVAFIGDFPTP